ncbi:hypothetical protein [Microvirga sesbaniae]|uniref:hypothetical protein n=1 Tax=Microvirga sesbaniae TaxID=681392 RepID=UPI0021C57A7B|nr:hypothetical protein [Microvirga sp. HBU67692]
MTVRTSILALTLAVSALHATQASAFFSRADRPPPNGMNGASLTGRADRAPSVDRAPSGETAPRAVVLPDGVRVVVK